MKLRRIHIENFGVLSGYDLELTDGLNVLTQKNGWGKSTLAVFIKAMFYGLPVTSKRSLDENERKKYAPWQGGVWGGYLTFETAHGRFRVERTFSDKESGDTFALYDLATNLPSSAYSKNLGEELFGIDADGYERSTYLPQRALSEKNDNISITAKLGNLLDDVDDMGSFDDAAEALEKRRKYYVLTGNRGKIAELEDDLRKAQTDLEACRRAEEALRIQERDAAVLNGEIEATAKAEEETRTRLRAAGLARERAALLGQKARMEKEIADLSARLEETERRFHGKIPTREELAECADLHSRIRDVRARRDALSESPRDEENLRLLSERYPAGLPDAAELDRMDAEARRIAVSDDRIREWRERPQSAERSSLPVPPRPRVDAAFDALDRAENLQQNIARLRETAPAGKRSAKLPLALFFLVFGATVAALSFLPALSSVFPAMTGGGALFFLAGAVLLFLSGKRGHTRDADGIREMEDERSRATQSVCDLLAEYQVSPNDSLREALNELSARIRDAEDTRRESERALAALEAETEQRNTLADALRREIGQYVTLSGADDLAGCVRRMRVDADRAEQLRASVRQRDADVRSANDALNQLRDQLRRFLVRYDPEERVSAAECLNSLSASLTERERLIGEIRSRKDALNAFLRENDPGSLPAPGADGFDELSARQNELNERREALYRKRENVCNLIDRLSDSADRIPDLEDTVAFLGAEIRECRANAATIDHTKKYLEEAKIALSTRYLDGMQKSFRQRLCELTGRSGDDATMDPSFEIRLCEMGQTRTMQSFSRGWRDAVGFCVRLSLTDALFDGGEAPFLLLDDPFVNLDDERLRAAHRLLHSLADEYQILYMVCREDRAGA